MDFSERAKKNLFEIDFESEIKNERINYKYQLRKKHNQNKLMEIRKKRILLLNQNSDKNNESNSEKTLLVKSEISILFELFFKNMILN